MAKGKDPAFLFYPDAFLGGCTFLSLEDRGRYITVLCLMHQHGRLDQESFEKAIGLPLGSVSVKLLAKFDIDENGNYFNSRLEEEIFARAKFIGSRKNNGSLGGRPPKNEKANNNLSVNLKDNLMGNLPKDINKDKNISNIEGGVGETKSQAEKWFAELMAAKITHERIGMLHRLKPNEVEYLIGQFITYKAITKTFIDYEDLVTHCTNWIKLNKKEQLEGFNQQVSVKREVRKLG